MPFENTEILEFNQYQKPDKAPFIIYADLECIIEKIDGCKSNHENPSKTKVSEHIASVSNHINNIFIYKYRKKYDVYRGKYCMNKFCEFLRKHATKIINFRKKKMKLLTKD